VELYGQTYLSKLYTAANQLYHQVGLANVGKSTLFQAITKCDLGNPAV
jgi:50S ribosomal subunit-associated GTPase HflX